MKYEIVKEIPRPEIRKIPVQHVHSDFIFYISNHFEMYFLLQGEESNLWGFVFAGIKLHSGTGGHQSMLTYQAPTKTESIARAFRSNLKVYGADSFREACEMYIEIRQA